MKIQDEHRTKLDAQLRELTEEVDRLKAKIGSLRAEASAELHGTGGAAEKAREVRHAGASAWQELKSGAENAYEEVRKGAKSAVSKFKS
jgi:predicted  nucleic acid-binding Zn-ribbon protein